MALVFFLISPILYTLISILQAESAFKKNTTMGIGQCKLTISEEGLYRELENSTLNVVWSKIKMVSKDEKRYFLYLSDLQAVIIKKSPDNMDESETLHYNSLINKSLNEEE